jgi:serine/threonine-protein kinase RsbW
VRTGSLPERDHMHEGSITIRLRAEVPEVERLNRLIRHFGELHDIPGRTLYAVNLAVDELVSNVILYAFDNPMDQEVVVKLEVTDGFVCASIGDQGRAFDPLKCAAPDLNAPLEQREVGGLGIHLVRSLMDDVEYRREGPKNVLTVRKRMR